MIGRFWTRPAGVRVQRVQRVQRERFLRWTGLRPKGS